MKKISPKNSSLEKAVLITGPTASGKTRLGARLALDFGGEIISADSRQVYRGLDIGSGKDVREYSIGHKDIPYHLVDIADPAEEYNLMRFSIDFSKAFEDVSSRGRIPFVVGGSPLYVSSIINRYTLPGGPRNAGIRMELDGKSNNEIVEMLHDRGHATENIDPDNRNRLIRIFERISQENASTPNLPDAEWLIIGTFLHRSEIHRRIRERLEKRLSEGMIEEVENLHRSGLSWERLEYFGLEYKWIALHLEGKITLDEMKTTLEAKIRQFARRQDIWFRKLERQGWRIHWKNPENYGEIKELVGLLLGGEEVPEPGFRLADTLYGPKSR